MDHDQLTEHLKFAAELGVAGVSRDPTWRKIGVGCNFPAGPSEYVETVVAGRNPSENAPVPFFGSSAQALSAIRTDIGDCTRCKLHSLGRRQIVFGVGNPNADLMFVGEAPGADEDIKGEPFVGRAGQLLTKIIEAIGSEARGRLHRERDQVPPSAESQSRAGRGRHVRAISLSAD